MTDPNEAVEHFKSLLENYDFLNGRNHVIKFISNDKKNIEILFVFGLNITAYFDYQMGAWFQLKSRHGDIHGFYFKDEKTKYWMSEEIRKATTCVCGLPNFSNSDGYPYMVKCPNGRDYHKCKTIEQNQFSVLVPNYTR